jgi:hypothetical protein
MIYLLKFLGVMVSMILADVCWTYYFMKVSERKAIAAGIWGSSVLIFGAFTTINYVEDRTLLLAAILGSFIGTAGTVWYKNWHENKKSEKKDKINLHD